MTLIRTLVVTHEKYYCNYFSQPTLLRYEQHLATVAQGLNATQLAVTSFPAVRLPLRRAVRVRPLRKVGVSVRQARESARTAM